MDITFYYNKSDDNKINKDLELGEELHGELRDSSDIMQPVIRFESADFIRYNYAYIPMFNRYYSVEDINCVSRNIYDITFSEDVLMSFRANIVALAAIVDKQTDDVNGDEYIDDSSLVMDNVMFGTTYEFPSGFNDNPSYILITAG